MSIKGFFLEELLFEIPSSWKWVRLCRTTEIVSGVTKGSKTKEDTIELPYLRVANVQRGYLNLNDVKSISVPLSKAQKLYLQHGEILFNEGGDLDKLGRGWLCCES
jgi:type I restriction enzyme S subunit